MFKGKYLFVVSNQQQHSKVLEERKGNEDGTEKDPDDKWTDLVLAWNGVVSTVVHVDCHQE